MIPAGVTIVLALIGGLFIGYQLGAMVGWAVGFKRRGAMADEFEPLLFSMERHIGWQRGRLGWATPDRREDETEKPAVFS